MVELKLDPNKLTKYERARIIGARSSPDINGRSYNAEDECQEI